MRIFICIVLIAASGAIFASEVSDVENQILSNIKTKRSYYEIWTDFERLKKINSNESICALGRLLFTNYVWDTKSDMGSTSTSIAAALTLYQMQLAGALKCKYGVEAGMTLEDISPMKRWWKESGSKTYYPQRKQAEQDAAANP